jgi:hypothetical protein
MLEIWFSVGYILLLAVFLFAFILWRSDSLVIAVAALVVGMAYWGWWEYARPTWTTGIVSGTEVRRSDTDARGMTRDVQYVYMRNQADAGIELENEDSWWWFKRNSERVFNNAKTAGDRKTEVTVIWTRWRSQLFSWHPNIIDFGPAGSWPLWQLRVLTFYAVTAALWLCYFYAFVWLHRRLSRDDELDEA